MPLSTHTSQRGGYSAFALVAKLHILRLSAPLALVAALALAGCGGSSGASTDTVTVASTPTNTTSTGATAAKTSTKPTSTNGATTPSGAHSTPAPTTSTSSTGTTATSPSKPTPPPVQLALSSPAFRQGSPIPARYTCAGANVSPPLRWQKVPAETAQLFLFALPLTGGGKNEVLWAVGNISPSEHEVPAGSIPAGAVLGRNSSGGTNWGLCGAKGKRVGVAFVLYALRQKVPVSSGFDPYTTQHQFHGHTTGAGLTFGVYQHA